MTPCTNDLKVDSVFKEAAESLQNINLFFFNFEDYYKTWSVLSTHCQVDINVAPDLDA